MPFRPFWRRRRTALDDAAGDQLEAEDAPPTPPWQRKGMLVGCAALVVLAIAAVIFLAFSSSAAPAPATQSDALDLDALFLAGVQADRIREASAFYSAEPHLAGSPRDFATAAYTRDRWREAGLDARLVPFDIVLSYPEFRSVRITSTSPPIVLSLTEAAVAGDACTTAATAVPTFNAYSASGNVTGPVVYANYGRQEDFELLAAMGINLSGCIALVRYGRLFRGLKVMIAEAFNVSGVLIYSDPLDDGFARGPVYPEGPWRPPTSVQRGSAQFLSIMAGDPSTPGYPSLPGAPRQPLAGSGRVPAIPVQPLSYADAEPILSRLQGSPVPPTWQGGLNITYHTGTTSPGEEVSVNMVLQLREEVGTVWDVIGEVRGAVEPDRMVIIGNHRDAWVCGAVDPVSGSATLLEVVRSLGGLLSRGWRPRRTLVVASWDAEEYGLMGSTEFAEQHAAALQVEAVAYLNVDELNGANPAAKATPSLAPLILEVAKLVPSADGNGTLFHAMQRAAENSSVAPAVEFLGSGSDYTAFYHHLGVSSVDLSMKGPYGVYHSTMDSFDWMARYGDPTFSGHAAVARWWGLLTLRLLESTILPFDLVAYARVIYDGVATLRGRLNGIPGVDFRGLDTTARYLVEAATAVARQLAALRRRDTAATALCGRMANDRLAKFERLLVAEPGLPGRQWYRHLIFSPGLQTGYAPVMFPGVDDALQRRLGVTEINARLWAVSVVLQEALTSLNSTALCSF
eukprot:EG_transcript_3038